MNLNSRKFNVYPSYTALKCELPQTLQCVGVTLHAATCRESSFSSDRPTANNHEETIANIYLCSIAYYTN